VTLDGAADGGAPACVGKVILRFWNDDVFKGLADVCDAILLALAERK